MFKFHINRSPFVIVILIGRGVSRGTVTSSVTRPGEKAQ